MSDTELLTEVTAPVPEPNKPRKYWVDQVILYALSFLLALVISGILIAFANPDVREAAKYFFSAPMDTISATWTAVSEAYKALFSGSVIDFGAYTVADALEPFTETLYTSTSLIFAGLAVALPFRAGLFNIGAQGQLILGAIFAGYVGFTFSMPFPVHLLVAILAGILGGAIWGGIAGALKSQTGAHEVIVTIMLNWIAIYFLQFLLTKDAFQREGRDDPLSPAVETAARLPKILGDDYRLNLGFILALLAAGFVWWLLERSTVGFEFRAVGANPNAAAHSRHQRQARALQRDGDRRWPGRACRHEPDPRRCHRVCAGQRDRRRDRLRRDHRRPARQGQSDRCGPRRHPDGWPAGRRIVDAGSDVDPDRHRPGHAVPDRPVHRGAPAGPQDLPPPGA